MLSSDHVYQYLRKLCLISTLTNQKYLQRGYLFIFLIDIHFRIFIFFKQENILTFNNNFYFVFTDEERLITLTFW
jgi:hypothetical protein